MTIRLKKETWTEIQRRYVEGESAKELARSYRVKVQTIHGRSSRERWRDAATPVPAPKAATVDRLEAAADRLEAAARTLMEAK